MISNKYILYEKYRPKKLEDFVGNDDIVKKLKNWLENFKKDKTSHSNLLLIGSSGIGKTTLAQILLEHYGYEVIEFNASDTRNGDQIDSIFTELFHNNTNIVSLLDGNHKKMAVIMDEVDGLTIGDKGGMKRLQYYLHKNNFKLPIILTSNISQYTCNGSKKLLEIKKLCHIYTLSLPDKDVLFKYISNIVKLEGIDNIIIPKFIDIIISKCNNDFRCIFNTIEMIILLSKNTNIDELSNYLEYNSRDISYDVYQACNLIFSSDNITLDNLFYLFGLERYNLPITLYDNLYNYIDIFNKDNLDIINKMLNNYVKSILYENILYNDLEWEFFEHQCSSTVINVYILNKLLTNKKKTSKVVNSKLLGKINSINANTETRDKISSRIKINSQNYHYYLELILNEILNSPLDFKLILDRHNLSKEELLRMIKSCDSKNRLVAQLKEIGIITQKELDRIA